MSEWIAVADKMPSRGDYVLVWFKDGHQAVAKFSGKRWFDPGEYPPNNVFTTPQFWAPLPPPPSNVGGRTA